MKERRRRYPVQRTFYAHRPLAHYMSVNHGSREIGVTQQFLHGANVGAGLKQMRGKAVAKSMTTRRLRHPGFVSRRLDPPLHDFLMLMMANRSAGVGIPAKRVCWKHPLPAPLNCRARILTRKRRGHRNSRFPQAALALESIKQFREMFAKRRDERRRQHRHSIL